MPSAQCPVPSGDRVLRSPVPSPRAAPDVNFPQPPTARPSSPSHGPLLAHDITLQHPLLPFPYYTYTQATNTEAFRFSNCCFSLPGSTFLCSLSPTRHAPTNHCRHLSSRLSPIPTRTSACPLCTLLHRCSSSATAIAHLDRF